VAAIALALGKLEARSVRLRSFAAEALSVALNWPGVALTIPGWAFSAEFCCDATDHAQKLPSLERKRAYLRHLPSISDEALLVTLADKVHNARSILGDYLQIGDEVWSRFNVGKEEQLAYYSGLLEIFRNRTAPAKLIDEFGRVVEELRKAR
jgi:hypothetical protein